MKSRSRLILAFLSVSAAVAALSASGAAQGHSGPGSRGAEVAERSIRKLVTEYERAWNTHDMEAWAALYTPDSDFVNRRGGWWDSRKVNTDHHTAIHNILADPPSDAATIRRHGEGMTVTAEPAPGPRASVPTPNGQAALELTRFRGHLKNEATRRSPRCRKVIRRTRRSTSGRL